MANLLLEATLIGWAFRILLFIVLAALAVTATAVAQLIAAEIKDRRCVKKLTTVTAAEPKPPRAA